MKGMRMGRGRNRGRRKRKEEEIAARRDLTDDELDIALAEIDKGSDRVAAILGCALVENHLVGAMISHLHDASDSAKLFDDVRGPFNTFYAQIVAAKALGLFDGDTADAMHAIRLVRNEFAHSLRPKSFEDQAIVAKCAILQTYDDED